MACCKIHSTHANAQTVGAGGVGELAIGWSVGRRSTHRRGAPDLPAAAGRSQQTSKLEPARTMHDARASAVRDACGVAAAEYSPDDAGGVHDPRSR